VSRLATASTELAGVGEKWLWLTGLRYMSFDKIQDDHLAEVCTL